MVQVSKESEQVSDEWGSSGAMNGLLSLRASGWVGRGVDERVGGVTQ